MTFMEWVDEQNEDNMDRVNLMDNYTSDELDDMYLQYQAEGHSDSL